jgi:hypothetical protein
MSGDDSRAVGGPRACIEVHTVAREFSRWRMLAQSLLYVCTNAGSTELA